VDIPTSISGCAFEDAWGRRAAVRVDISDLEHLGLLGAE
jgi:hypothetical protein